MKQQKGFTLVELMVVLVIIGILSVGGITQYGKFIKGARDTTRISDIKAIDLAIIESINNDGTVPNDASELAKKVYAIAGKNIIDPLDGKAACLKEDKSPVTCHYQYMVCDGGTGYILSTFFESANNTSKYAKDEVSTTDADVLDEDLYELGSCNVPDTAQRSEIPAYVPSTTP